MMKNHFMKLLTLTLFSMVFAATANAVPVLEKKFIATAAEKSSYKETVSGCKTVSVNVAQQNIQTVANLYDDASFELGYDGNNDGDLLDGSPIDIVIVTGSWAMINADATQIRFQPDGSVVLNTGGWQLLSDWMSSIACSDDTSNNYVETDAASWRVLKAEMKKNASNAGSLRLTVEGYGQTTNSQATPPKTDPKIKLDVKASGTWVIP